MIGLDKIHSDRIAHGWGRRCAIVEDFAAPAGLAGTCRIEIHRAALARTRERDDV